MQISQVGSLRRGGQSGFTLIELIVVIVILGILAATALPKFASLGGDARLAKLTAGQGSVKSALAMYRGRWLAAGSPTTAATTFADGVIVSTAGHVTFATLSAAAGLTDFDTATAGTIKADASHASCAFTYNETTGVLGALPAVASCE